MVFSFFAIKPTIIDVNNDINNKIKPYAYISTETRFRSVENAAVLTSHIRCKKCFVLWVLGKDRRFLTVSL